MMAARRSRNAAEAELAFSLLVQQMEKEGVVSPPNHSGKCEILIGAGVDRGDFEDLGEE